jgi:hypothetical protein
MINNLVEDSFEVCKGDAVVTYASLIAFSPFRKLPLLQLRLRMLC